LGTAGSPRSPPRQPRPPAASVRLPAFPRRRLGLYPLLNPPNRPALLGFRLWGDPVLVPPSSRPTSSTPLRRRFRGFLSVELGASPRHFAFPEPLPSFCLAITRTRFFFLLDYEHLPLSLASACAQRPLRFFHREPSPDGAQGHHVRFSRYPNYRVSIRSLSPSRALSAETAAQVFAL